MARGAEDVTVLGGSIGASASDKRYRLTQLAAQEPDHRVGQVELPGLGGEVVDADAGADQLQRQVADHLGRRRDLDQPAEQPVGGGVGVDPFGDAAKSFTIELIFRSPETTLTSEQVEASVQRTIAAAKARGWSLRA
mgnify:CR=1 FL=1